MRKTVLKSCRLHFAVRPDQFNFREHGSDRPCFCGKQKKIKNGPKIFICIFIKKLTNWPIDAVQTELIKTAVGKLLHYF